MSEGYTRIIITDSFQGPRRENGIACDFHEWTFATPPPTPRTPGAVPHHLPVHPHDPCHIKPYHPCSARGMEMGIRSVPHFSPRGCSCYDPISQYKSQVLSPDFPVPRLHASPDCYSLRLSDELPFPHSQIPQQAISLPRSYPQLPQEHYDPAAT